MIDRIDLLVEVQRTDMDAVGDHVMSSQTMFERVQRAVQIQMKRFEMRISSSIPKWLADILCHTVP